MTLAAYTQQILMLLPRGAAWAGENLQALAGSFAGEVYRLDQAIAGPDGLIVESIPSTAVQLLPDFEAMLGLPYPGFDIAATTAQRQADIVAALIAQGGQSAGYFLGIVAAHGHVGATITTGSAFCCGDPIGVPIDGEAWIFYWQINMVESGPDLLLQYLITKYAPAHTIVGFAYDA